LPLLYCCLVLPSTKHTNARCWKMDIEVEHLSGLYFIDKASIQERILNLGDPILGTKLDSIRIDHIRHTLVQLPSVNTAEVYTTVDGILKVTVTQRTPLFRVINRKGDSFTLIRKEDECHYHNIILRACQY